MIFVPLPFLVTLLCAIFVARSLALARATGERHPLLGALVAYGLLSFLIGLRWGYGFDALAGLQPVVSAAALALTVSAFRNWAGRPAGRAFRYLDIVAPTLAVALVGQAIPEATGVAVIALFTGAGLLLGRLSFGGANALSRAAFEEAPLLYRALQAMAVFFLLSALVDVAIDIDFQRSGGVHAARIVALSNIPALLVLSVAAAIAGRAAPAEPPSAAPVSERAHLASEIEDRPADDDIQILCRLDAAMSDRALYRDPDLTLERLGRKLALPVRQLSGAINRLRGQNVSQYVNAYRIREAQRLLETTDRSVTEIMFESGFQTKSNFNREFRRIASVSPSVWRSDHRQDSKARGNPVAG